MSYKLVDQILYVSPDKLPPTPRLVLLAFASFANDDGTSIYPAISQIEQRTGGLTRPCIFKAIKWLLGEKLLFKIMDNSKKRKPCKYQINTTLLDTWTPSYKKPANNFTSKPSLPELVNDVYQTSKPSLPHSVINQSNTLSCVGTQKENSKIPEYNTKPKIKKKRQQNIDRHSTTAKELKCSLEDSGLGLDDFMEIAKLYGFKPSRLRSQWEKFFKNYTTKSPLILTVASWKSKMKSWCQRDEGCGKTPDCTKITPLSEIEGDAAFVRARIESTRGYPNIRYLREKLKNFGGLDYALQHMEIPIGEDGDLDIIEN